MKHIRTPRLLICCYILLSCLVITACSNNDSSNAKHNTSSSNTHTLTGAAIKGIISDGIVSAYDISGENRELLVQSRTNQQGLFNLDLPLQYKRKLILLELSTDHKTRMRCDLSTGCIDQNTGQHLSFGETITLPASFKLLGIAGSNMQAQRSTDISPLTHLVVTTAKKLDNALTENTLKIASDWVSNALSLDTSPLLIEPKDITDIDHLSDLSTEELAQSILSAAMYTDTVTSDWSEGNMPIDAIDIHTTLTKASDLTQALSSMVVATNTTGIHTNNLKQIQRQFNTQSALLTPEHPNSDNEFTDITILAQPASATLSESQSIHLYVHMKSELALSYQWYKDNNPIPGATSSIYTKKNITTNDAGLYHLLVSNTFSEHTSLTASIKVNKAPSITQHPKSLSVAEGESFLLDVDVHNDEDLHYQWRKDGFVIPGATDAQYRVEHSTLSDDGHYRVSLSNGVQQLNSRTAKVWVSEKVKPIVITTAPQSKTIQKGKRAVFTVEASGDGFLRYQWRKDDVPIKNNFSPVLDIRNVSSAHTGNYTVVVSNSRESVSSPVASLTLAAQPSLTIKQQPQSASVMEGEQAQLSVGVESQSNAQYQWRKNGVLLANRQTPTLDINAAYLAHAGRYDVIVSVDQESIVSHAAELKVLPRTSPLAINQQPQTQTITEGEPLRLSVDSSGHDSIRYQWEKNGTIIPGATDAQYQQSNSQLNDAGAYRVRLSNTAQHFYSDVAHVHISERPDVVSIITSPQSKSIIENQRAIFTVEASGEGPLYYQWRKDGIALSHKRSPVLNIASVSDSHSGRYDVIVSNSQGSVISQVAQLTVLADIPPLVINRQPLSQSVTEGETILLTVDANDHALTQYQWQKNGVMIPGATHAQYQITNSQLKDKGSYNVTISNNRQQLHSSYATVWVSEKVEAVTIITSPQSKSITENKRAIFTVEAKGDGFLRYQWRKNGVPIDNEYSAILDIKSVSDMHAGRYDVMVSNSQGSIISQTAKLMILPKIPPLMINHQPQSQSVTVGQALSLSVGASGGESLSYQWFFNGEAIHNATTENLYIAHSTLGNEGNYSVLVNTKTSSQQSEISTVSVKPPPPRSIELTWDTPTEREDGSPLDFDEIVGYVIEYGNNEADLVSKVSVENQLPNSLVLNDLTSKALFLRISTIDSDYHQGAFSHPIKVSLQ